MMTVNATMEPYVPLSSVDGTLGTEEKNGSERLSVEELVERIVGGSTGRYLLLLPVFLISQLTSSIMCYHPVFTGYIPYTEWQCLSPLCLELLSNHTDNSTFYTRTTMCSNNLAADLDFIWTPTHSSFAVDWGIYCDKEGQKSSINSFYFIGALVGLVGSSGLYDRFGRKPVTLLAAAIAVFASLAQVFTNSFSMILWLRVAQGLGTMVAATGKFVWVMEFTTLRLRNLANCIMAITWPGGTALLILLSYFVTNWRHSVLIITIFTFLSFLPLLFFPESARLFAVQGNEEQALIVLRKMAKFFKKPLDPNTRLQVGEDDGSKSTAGFLKQIKDFKVYPLMLRRTCFLMSCWFLVSLFYYGLSFGWHKMGTDIYTSQGFAILSEGIAITSSYFVITVGGRKKSQIMSFLGIGALFLVAMIETPLSSKWDVSQVACLVAVIFITCEFVTIYLFTAELSPTSHRGMILCLSSGAARVGSFLGPYIVLLFDFMDRRIVMGVFAGLAILAAVGTWFWLVETSGQAIAETPADIWGKKRVVDGESVDGTDSISINKTQLLSKSQ